MVGQMVWASERVDGGAQESMLKAIL